MGMSVERLPRNSTRQDGIRQEVLPLPTQLETASCLLNVSGNLGLEFLQRGKFFLIPQFIHKDNFHLFTVELVVEIQEMNFNAQLWIGLIQRGPITYVQDSAVGLVPHDGMCRIHTTGRRQQAGGVDVGSRETKLMSELIAMHDPPGQGIGTPQHLTSGIEIAITNGFTNTRAADCLAVKRDSGDTVNREAQLFSQRFQQIDVSAPSVAKDEICA